MRPSSVTPRSPERQKLWNRFDEPFAIPEQQEHRKDDEQRRHDRVEQASRDGDGVLSGAARQVAHVLLDPCRNRSFAESRSTRDPRQHRRSSSQGFTVSLKGTLQ
jgi:hypothetical protein